MSEVGEYLEGSMGKDNQADKGSRPGCPNIEEELRAICAPCKSGSLNYIKVMCERALLSYRHYRDVVYKTKGGGGEQGFKQFPVTDVCSVCREAIIASTMYPNLMQLSILGMNCIKQILVPGLLDTSHKMTILAVLNEVTLKASATIRTKSSRQQSSSGHNGGHSNLNHNKEQVLLKVIQTVILFLSPEILEFNETIITLIVSILSTIFSLSGYYQLIQMSQLAIRQLVSISLDHIDLRSVSSDETGEGTSEVVPILLIKDISVMIDREVVESVKSVSSSKTPKESLTPLSLLKGGITIPSEICLDLWYEILDKDSPGRRSLLEKNSDLGSLVLNVLFPALTKCIQGACSELNPKMSQSIHDFIMFARFIRLFIRILEFNSNKNSQGPFVKDCVCNSLMSFIQAISADNFLSIPSWSLQCILEMLSELVRNSDVMLIIGNYSVKSTPSRVTQTQGEEPETRNLLELVISTLNKLLVSLNDQLDILHSAESTHNLSVPSFLNENISLPSILLPQHNNTSIECGYFIIGSSKKSSEKNLCLIDLIMEDDRIYHTSKYYGFDGNLAHVGGGGGNLHAGGMQSLSTLSSVVLISLRPIEISLLVFDIIVNISTCLDSIFRQQLGGEEFEGLIFNIWDEYYALIKQCMSYYLLRYYVYRIITFLFMLSNSSEFKGRLSNILELVFEPLQKYYDQVLECRILSDAVLLEKVFSVYKCFLSISYQFSESLDEVSWQLLFRYMEYIDRILDVGLGPMTKSKSSAELADLEGVEQSMAGSKSEEFSSSSITTTDTGESTGGRSGQIVKTLMAESTILRASHQAFLKDHMKNISENTMNCVIKGIYKELSFNMYRENLNISVFDYMLRQLGCIIQSIYDKMSYNLFIPIWNNQIIPLLLETVKQNNHSHAAGIACAPTPQHTCTSKSCMHTDSDCPHKKINDVEINKGRVTTKKSNVEDVGMFNSIMSFLSSTITTVFKFIDEDNSQLFENNVQTSLLSPYLMLMGSFPMYNTLLLRSLYSILCSTIPKLDDSTWILINVLINNIIEERFCEHIKYLNYERPEDGRSIVVSGGSLSFLEEAAGSGSCNGGNEQQTSAGAEVDCDVELLQALFPLVEYVSNEAEIRFLSGTNKISSSWNLLIGSIAVFGRVQISTENLAFQAVSLLWRLTDLIGSSLPSIVQEEEGLLGSCFAPGSEDDIAAGRADEQLIFDQRNVKIGMNKRNKVYYSDYTSIEIIWLNIILQLEDLCKDSRQEIRNCSLKSLFSALITHCKYIKSRLLRSIIVKMLEHVLSLSVEQYNHSFQDAHLGEVLDFDSLSVSQTGVSLESEGTVSASQGGELSQPDDCPSLSTNFIRNLQQNQVWEGTLEISIDGTLRVIKELSQNYSLADKESQSICFECTMFLYDTISALLSSHGKEDGRDSALVYKKEIQIISIKTLYELLVVSMRIGDKRLWSFGFSIYARMVDRIITHSFETLRKLQRAEEFIKDSSLSCRGDEGGMAIYRSYNSYVHKLIKFYLSDKLAESLLQTVVDLLILIVKDPDHMEMYRLFDESFNHLTILLDLIISIITCTDTFIHHTVPLDNLNLPDKISDSQGCIFEKTQAGGEWSFAGHESGGRLYREFCECFGPSSPFVCGGGIWGRERHKEDVAYQPLYVPKLVNFEKDHHHQGEAFVVSGKDSNSSSLGRGDPPRLIYIEGYSNSGFIHESWFKGAGWDISLLKLLYHKASSELSSKEGLNIVYLLRNVTHSDMFRPDANYCYYLKGKEASRGGSRTDGYSKGGVGKGMTPESGSYLCSIRNNNDYLSSSISSEIRFVTTIQNMGLETLQFFMMSLLPAFNKREGNSMMEMDNRIEREDSLGKERRREDVGKENKRMARGDHDSGKEKESNRMKEESHGVGKRNQGLFMPLMIKKLLDTLVVHRDMFADTNKIGISSKVISLLVGYNRNILLGSMEKVVEFASISQGGGLAGFLTDMTGGEGSAVRMMMTILPYILERLLLIMELDRERMYGIWMVAKEALLVIIHDWVSFVGCLRLELQGSLVGGEDLGQLRRTLNDMIVENVWPLFVDVIGRMVREEQGFGLRVAAGGSKASARTSSSYVENYCLYFDILLVNVAMDFILVLKGRERNIVDDLEMFELPYKYYMTIIKYFEDFVNDNRKQRGSGSLELRKGGATRSHAEENHYKVSSSSVDNDGKGYERGAGGNDGKNHHYSTLNASYQTLKIYIIEKLFFVFEHLSGRLRSVGAETGRIGGGDSGDTGVSAVQSKVARLVSSVEELGDMLHRMTGSMFRSFSMEDLQSGLRPMPHLKIEEMHSLLFLIEKHYCRVLRDFKCRENFSGVQLDVMRMERKCFGNFVQLVLPELIECITCKDQNIRQKLRSILSCLARDVSRDYNSMQFQLAPQDSDSPGF